MGRYRAARSFLSSSVEINSRFAAAYSPITSLFTVSVSEGVDVLEKLEGLDIVLDVVCLFINSALWNASGYRGIGSLALIEAVLVVLLVLIECDSESW